MWEENPIIVKLDETVTSVDFQKLADEGAELFILNVLSTDKFVTMTDSPTYRDFVTKAKATGKLTCGRLKHHPGVDVIAYANTSTQMSRVERIISGYRPDGLVVDCQIGEWVDGLRNVTTTPSNLRLSMQLEIDRAWKMCKLPPILYTGRWFVDKFAPSDITVMLDNANKVQKLIPTMLGFWKFLNQPIQSLAEIKGRVPIPTAAEEESKLNIGSYTKADAWEVGSVLHPAVKGADGKMVPFTVMLWMGTIETLYGMFGKEVPGTEPPPPPPPPDDEEPPDDGEPGDGELPGGDIIVIDLDIEALMGKLDELLTEMKKITKHLT